MLKNLTIDNYALIDHLEINFPNGLIIITGETGAGKSILLGALSLLTGAKADSSLFLNSDKNCVIEGEFDLSGHDDIQDYPRELIIRRVITPAGRSRIFVNDEPISVASLSALAKHIIDIHGQHNHLLLTSERYQLSVLDHFSGKMQLLEEYKKAFNEYKEAYDALSQMENGIRKGEEELEYKEFQLDKLEKAALVDGELEELEAEYDKLANAEQIREGIFSALGLLNSDSGSILQNLKEVTQILRKYYTFVPEFGQMAERLESCRIECKDIEADLESKGVEITSSPQRMKEVEERIALLNDLLHRYNLGNIGELIDYRDALKAEISKITFNKEAVEELRSKVQELDSVSRELADSLSQERKSASVALSELMTTKLRGLGMAQAELKVEVEKTEHYTESGADRIKFHFSANAGRGMQPLEKVASGGELSRIMLSLKDVMAKFTGMPTMIFDEIDTGVSGSVADKMGELIGEMGKNMQVIAITHLPQIAVKGSAHFKVYKENVNGKVRSQIKLLSKDERVMEIAGMLSGSELSQAAIENAKFLLQ